MLGNSLSLPITHGRPNLGTWQEQDIAAGRNLGNLPPELASALQAALQTPVDDDDIIGDVEL